MTARKLTSRLVGKHSAFYIGVAAGILVFCVGLAFWRVEAFAVSVNALFAVYLLLIARKLPRLTPAVLRRHADESDLPTWIILGVVVVAVAASGIELFQALSGRGAVSMLDVGIGLVSVLLGWFTIHTMAALHYAFEYYQSSNEPGADTALGGLAFPDGDSPDGTGFLYFSYAIGTSTAVSDVTVVSNKMRKLVMLHSVFSFFFNTLIVAAMVNVTVAVGGA